MLGKLCRNPKSMEPFSGNIRSLMNATFQEERLLLEIKRKSNNKWAKNGIKRLNEFQYITNPSNILERIQSNEFIHDSNAYEMAMKQCNHLRAFDVTEQIICLLIDEKPDLLNNIIFNTLFVGLGKARNIKKCKKYFKLMIKMGLKPNKPIFGTLIYACANRGTKYSIAFGARLIHILTDVYQLELEAAMIIPMMKLYSAQDNMDKVHYLFEHYCVNATAPTKNQKSLIYGAYLNILADNGDIGNVKYVVDLMDKNGIDLDVAKYSSIIKAHLNTGYYNECLHIFDMMNKYGIFLDDICINHLLKTYLYLQNDYKVKKDKNNERIYHDKIMNDLPTILNRFRIKEDHIMRITQLSSIILYYSEVDPIKIVNYFENNMDKYKYIKPTAIDLHEYTYTCAQFILRYMFYYRFNEMKNRHKKLDIIVGKGQSLMKQFVINEIESWNSVLIPQNDTNNTGRLLIPLNQLKQMNDSPTKQYFEPLSCSWLQTVRVI